MTNVEGLMSMTIAKPQACGEHKLHGKKSPGKLTLWACCDLYVQISRAGPVEFAEVNSLPGPQHQFSLFDQDATTRTHQRRFDMGIAVSLGVTITGRIFGDQPLE